MTEAEFKQGMMDAVENGDGAELVSLFQDNPEWYKKNVNDALAQCGRNNKFDVAIKIISATSEGPLEAFQDYDTLQAYINGLVAGNQTDAILKMMNDRHHSYINDKGFDITDVQQFLMQAVIKEDKMNIFDKYVELMSNTHELDAAGMALSALREILDQKSAEKFQQTFDAKRKNLEIVAKASEGFHSYDALGAYMRVLAASNQLDVILRMINDPDHRYIKVDRFNIAYVMSEFTKAVIQENRMDLFEQYISRFNDHSHLADAAIGLAMCKESVNEDTFNALENRIDAKIKEIQSLAPLSDQGEALQRVLLKNITDEKCGNLVLKVKDSFDKLRSAGVVSDDMVLNYQHMIEDIRKHTTTENKVVKKKFDIDKYVDKELDRLKDLAIKKIDKEINLLLKGEIDFKSTPTRGVCAKAIEKLDPLINALERQHKIISSDDKKQANNGLIIIAREMRSGLSNESGSPKKFNDQDANSMSNDKTKIEVLLSTLQKSNPEKPKSGGIGFFKKESPVKPVEKFFIDLLTAVKTSLEKALEKLGASSPKARQ